MGTETDESRRAREQAFDFSIALRRAAVAYATDLEWEQLRQAAHDFVEATRAAVARPVGASEEWRERWIAWRNWADKLLQPGPGPTGPQHDAEARRAIEAKIPPGYVLKGLAWFADVAAAAGKHERSLDARAALEWLKVHAGWRSGR